MKRRVLVIEDDDGIRSNLLELLEEEGYDGLGAADGKTGIAAALGTRPDVILCDIMMPVMDGYQVLRTLRDYPDTAAVPFIFLTAKSQRADMRLGMNLGADDYVTKPFTRSDVLGAIHTRLERQQMLTASPAATASMPPQPIHDVAGVIVVAPRMRELYAQASRVGAGYLSVLLLGETGVGKDVLAHAIHKASARAAKPFVPLNCAAFADTLLETELFGHEKGAFTGAVQAQPGLFETASGGTVFLDEVGELPRAMQAKLLRVIEDGRVLRVGGRTPRDVDVRFIAATNRELDRDIARGTFRPDLYFRIAGVSLTVPPLRERRQEIEPLARSFVTNACRRMGYARVPSTSPDALTVLQQYDWPGNVRELRNVMERAVTLSAGQEIRVEHLPENVAHPSAGVRDDAPDAHLRVELLALERQRIIDALEECGGNQTRAAERLGISRRTLLNRLDELDLPRPRKRL